MSARIDARMLTATMSREVEALLLDLAPVCHTSWAWEYDGKSPLRGRIRYTTKQLGLFDDSALPPELEVMRKVRELAFAKRLRLDGDECDGRTAHVTLRSGLPVTIELHTHSNRR